MVTNPARGNVGRISGLIPYQSSNPRSGSKCALSPPVFATERADSRTLLEIKPSIGSRQIRQNTMKSINIVLWRLCPPSLLHLRTTKWRKENLKMEMSIKL
jgi:hypothetical protein